MFRQLVRLVPALAGGALMRLPASAARRPIAATMVAMPMHSLPASCMARLFSADASSSVDEAAISRIWIGGLPYSTTKEEVEERFASYGAITDMSFPTRADGSPNGTCVITFAAPASATAALGMNESVFGTRWIRVNLLKQESRHAPSLELRKNVDGVTKVFFGNVPYSISETDIEEVFSSCGDVAFVNIVRDNQTHVSRGYGFVDFKDADSASAAVGLSGTFVGGRSMSVNYAKPTVRPLPIEERGTRAPRKVFVANLPSDIEEETLQAMFEHCGTIEHINVAFDKVTGTPRGFAHIEFASAAGARSALALKGADIEGKEIHVDLAIDKRRVPRVN
ncbi:Aste57867_5602 [Aphanomyces stellatus]|uniref:Aste57867_5602 protein n=1 Tax=Aphanomyces stellatus TaxID=120398 RepID=A0A485KFL5_9STRA|nr:hypothetical protein As57867_005589 [Aphanomyces stellatus]VFT82648.1 Aste57867_5602 [Aphanomyces stellatus]